MPGGTRVNLLESVVAAYAQWLLWQVTLDDFIFFVGLSSPSRFVLKYLQNNPFYYST